MAKKPNFTGDAVIGYGRISAANPNRDGSGAVVDIVTGGAKCTRIERIEITPIVTTTEGVVRLYVQPAAGAIRLLRELPVQGNVLSASNPATTLSVEFPAGLNLPVGAKLHASTEKAEAMEVWAFGGHYAEPA